MAGEVEGAKAASLAFRIAALALSVAAAVVMGNSGRVVSYNDYGALTYFVAASAVSAVLVALALYWFVHGDGGRRVGLLDAAAQALLFSASGAALAARACFVDRTGGAFGSRTGIAAAVGACAAAAVALAALTSFPPRGGGGGESDDGGCGHGCKHGC